MLKKNPVDTAAIMMVFTVDFIKVVFWFGVTNLYNVSNYYSMGKKRKSTGSYNI